MRHLHKVVTYWVIALPCCLYLIWLLWTIEVECFHIAGLFFSVISIFWIYLCILWYLILTCLSLNYISSYFASLWLILPISFVHMSLVNPCPIGWKFRLLLIHFIVILCARPWSLIHWVLSRWSVRHWLIDGLRN